MSREILRFLHVIRRTLDDRTEFLFRFLHIRSFGTAICCGWFMV